MRKNFWEAKVGVQNDSRGGLERSAFKSIFELLRSEKIDVLNKF